MSGSVNVNNPDLQERQPAPGVDSQIQVCEVIANDLKRMIATRTISSGSVLALAKDGKDKQVQRLLESAWTVFISEAPIGSYLFLRLFYSHQDALEGAEMGAEPFTIMSLVSGKTISGRTDIPQFVKWVVTRWPELAITITKFIH